MSPQILDDAFCRVGFDQEPVFKFFITFSLFEKVLKENGFNQVAQNTSIHADWKKFAKEINDQFLTTIDLPNHQELNDAVHYLLNQPPQKQVFRDGHIQFANTGRSSDSDAEWLAVLINRVRNNLFRGGKFSYERPRDTLLIQCSLIILEEWASLDSGVKGALLNIR